MEYEPSLPSFIRNSSSLLIRTDNKLSEFQIRQYSEIFLSLPTSLAIRQSFRIVKSSEAYTNYNRERKKIKRQVFRTEMGFECSIQRNHIPRYDKAFSLSTREVFTVKASAPSGIICRCGEKKRKFFCGYLERIMHQDASTKTLSTSRILNGILFERVFAIFSSEFYYYILCFMAGSLNFE